MKKDYPSYKLSGIGFIRDRMSEEDKRILVEFRQYVGITAGDRKVGMIEKCILQFYDVIELSFNNVDLNILRSFLYLLNRSGRSTETKNDIKKAVKRFLRWKYRDWSERFDELRDIKTADGTNHEKLNPSTILTTDELRMIVNSVDSLKYKALILLMFESAGRPEEILKLRWNDIDLEKAQITLYSSKTRKARTNPISESVVQLRRYKEECFWPPAQANDLVFPNPRDRSKPISVIALADFFRKTERSLNFGKRFFPYLLRHTRLTQVHKKLSAKAYEKFAGHSIDVGTQRYAHLDSDDVREEMLEKVYKVQQVSNQGGARIEVLESRIRELEDMIRLIISRANMAYDKASFPI